MCQDRPAIAGTALPPPGALETDPVFVLMMGIRLLNLRNLCVRIGLFEFRIVM
jgi:hypothetical protein